jgi:hypothetical protein
MVRTTAVLTLVATLTGLPILWPSTAPDADAAGGACEGGFLKIPALAGWERFSPNTLMATDTGDGFQLVATAKNPFELLPAGVREVFQEGSSAVRVEVVKENLLFDKVIPRETVEGGPEYAYETWVSRESLGLRQRGDRASVKVRFVDAGLGIWDLNTCSVRVTY